jgi:hypothetical protein
VIRETTPRLQFAGSGGDGGGRAAEMITAAEMMTAAEVMTEVLPVVAMTAALVMGLSRVVVSRKSLGLRRV